MVPTPIVAKPIAPRVAVANASGAVISANSYDEYGIPAATNLGRFAYTGQIRIPELGMYYYKARIYSPTLGRFIQTDPIGYEGGINLYAYVDDDPTNQDDPDGTCPMCWGAIAGALLDGGIEAGGQLLSKGKITSWSAVGKAAVRGAAVGALTGGFGNVARLGSVARGTARGLGNPFRGKTLGQAARAMERKGFVPRGPSPATGKGGYVNPKTGRSYHVDPGQRPPPRRSEPPHIDVNRDSKLTRSTPETPKRKFPVGDK